jgi:hypothetical protein
MSKRATLVLAAITAAMLAFILVYERHTLSSGELESRRGQVLDRFVRPRVHEIELRRGDELVVSLVRDQEAEETLDTFDVGTWRLTEPVSGDADADAIDGVLQACESLSARRTLADVSDEDRHAFGLDAPRLVLTLRVADETQVLRVGGDDEGAGGVYVEVEGSGRVQLVGRDFFEALDHDTDHFRSKELFPELASRDVQRVSWRLGSDEARLEQRDRRWAASAPFEGWARRAAVEAVFDALVDARVRSFVRDGADELVGSPQVSLTLTVRVRDEEGRDTGRTRETSFVVGSACPGGAEGEPETIAVRVDDGAVTCVARAALEPLFAAPASLRETRLLAATEDQVERIEIRAREGAALEVRRAEGDWTLAEGGNERPADEEAVAEYLRALRAQEAESFEPASPESLAARGLEPARARVVFHRSDDGVEDVIAVGALDTVGVWVRRGDEPVLARYVGDAADLLAASVLRFRSRELVGREPDDLLRLTIVRGGVEERLATENGAWRIEAPVALAADRVATRDVVRALTTLRAVRWESDAATGATGLDAPRIRVRLELREGTAPTEDEDGHDHGDEGGDEGDHAPATLLPTSVELLIGGDTDGGAFARLEGEPAVFVIAADVARALSQPLVDRELLGIDTSSATRVAITSSSGAFVLDKVDGRWTTGGRPAAADATDAFLERLRSLRARGVATYGGEGAFRAPRMVIEVSASTGDRRIEIGATEGEGAETWVHARRIDVPVDFQLSGDVVEALEGYRP